MDEDLIYEEATLRSVKATLKKLIDDDYPHDSEIQHYLAELSFLVEDDETFLERHKEELAEVRKILIESKPYIEDWKELESMFRLTRRMFPKSHWWWYPEEL